MSNDSNGEHKNKDYWSMTEGAFCCLIDEERTKFFHKVINNNVKNGDVVVDTGTGTGILAIFAAAAGAKKVYAIELDDDNIKTLQHNFHLNGYKDKIVAIKGDVTKIKLPEKVDVVICEMIATGLIEELQIQAMNNILKYTKDTTKVILNTYETFIDLVYNRDKYYGFQLKIFRYEYSDIEETKSNVMSDQFLINRVDLSQINRKRSVNKEFIFSIHTDGVLNGIRITGKTTFCDGSVFADSFAYSYPLILPVDDMQVFKGDQVLVKISYLMCGGINKLKYKIMKK